MTEFQTAMLSFLQDTQNEFNSEKEVDYFIEKHAPKLMEAACKQLMEDFTKQGGLTYGRDRQQTKGEDATHD